MLEREYKQVRILFFSTKNKEKVQSIRWLKSILITAKYLGRSLKDLCRQIYFEKCHVNKTKRSWPSTEPKLQTVIGGFDLSDNQNNYINCFELNE